MATAAKEQPDSVEYKKPDAAKAIEIYDKQIRPKLTQINTLKGDLSDPWGDLKEHARISKKDFGYVQGLVDEEDDAKRDHRLLSLFELLKARHISLPSDLVTRSQGLEGGSVVPIGEARKTPLVGVDDDFDEASEEELAAQKPRADDAEAKALKKPSVDLNLKPAAVDADLPPAA